MIFKAKYLTADGHAFVYVRIVTVLETGVSHTVGSLSMRRAEFDAFKLSCPGVEFEEETR